jgi:hypothetical protein
MSLAYKPLRLRLPDPHPVQKIFTNWHVKNPQAQVLVAPCGTKVGKSFGSSIWLATEALVTPGLYCIWIAPTYMKARIGYRYIKAMLPEHPSIQCMDGKLEIRFGNRSLIKFIHGKDAETTVEGEAVDRFVIDESGKQSKQLWYSLLTTITQTRGMGIVTGTPRGYTWYYDIFRQAKQGDPFFCWAQISTEQSPFISKQAVENAKRILPKGLFDQYYRAMFVSHSTVFGDISAIFDDKLIVKPNTKFWVHPDPAARALDTVTGWDMAKHRDFSVFYTVNTLGKCVGYARFNKVPYETQVDRLHHYMHKYFTGDRMLRYDATGVGNAVGEMIVDKDIDAAVTAVTFSNKSKQEMVSRTTHAIESGWHKAPRIEQLEHEFSSYEVSVTKSGLFSYSAPDGEHDDVVTAAMLAITGAYQSAQAEESEKVLDGLMNGSMDDDDITEAADLYSGDDGFFDDEKDEDNPDDFDFED